MGTQAIAFLKYGKTDVSPYQGCRRAMQRGALSATEKIEGELQVPAFPE